MSKKQMKFLIPLGLLLLSLVALAGCRPSTALTSLMNAMNALNPTQDVARTEEEQEENTADEYTDPIDEERDDAKIEEMETLIGKMLDNMDEETAEAALDAVYSAVAETGDWGVQEYNPDRIVDAEDEDSALARYVRGSLSREGSGTVGTTAGSGGTTTIKREGLTSSDGRQSETVPVTRDPESTDEPVTSQAGGQQGDSSAYGYGGSDDTTEPLPSTSTESEPTPSVTTDPEPSPSDSSEPEPSPSPSASDKPGTWYGHTIAATGEAAVLVCMLGGADRLVATNADFYYNDLVQEAWGDQLLNCEVLWDGDGTTALDGGYIYGEKFIHLMEDIQPDLCVQFEGYNTFSESGGDYDQVYALRYAYKLGYRSLTAMTSQEGITDAMYLLATSMDESEGSDDAWQIYEAYLSWCEKYRSDIQSRISTNMEVVYIEGWDDSTDIYLDYGNGKTLVSDEGMAYIRPGTAFRPLSTFLGYASVTDYAAEPEVCSMMTRDNGTTYKWESNTMWDDYTMDGDTCVVSPLAYCNYNSYWSGFDISGDLIPENMSPGITTLTIPGSTMSLSFNSMMNLGASNSNFKTVIAKDQATADAIRSSWQWDWSRVSYDFWSNGGHMGWNGYLYTVELPDGSTRFPTNLQGNYNVVVQPAGGIGSWVEGSPESILETIWAACELQGYYKDQSENRLEYLVDQFYIDFYGFSPQESGSIKKILATN